MRGREQPNRESARTGVSALPLSDSPDCHKITSFNKNEMGDGVKHAETHNDAYPGFSIFTRVVKTQAKIKNHPNILAGNLQKSVIERHKEKPRDRRALRTGVHGEDNTNWDPPPPPEKKWCPYQVRSS